MRLFVALPCPQAVRGALAALAMRQRGVGWAPREQIHLTLAFLGETPPDAYEEIRDALAAVGGGPFPLAVRGVGVFPPRGEPRVLWAGLDDSPPLVALRRRVAAALAAAGVESEARKFSPHLTLARLSGAPPGFAGEFAARHGLLRLEPFIADRFHLMSSKLRPDGAVHSVEATYPLAD